jgi:hypothetical protein
MQDKTQFPPYSHVTASFVSVSSDETQLHMDSPMFLQAWFSVSSDKIQLHMDSHAQHFLFWEIKPTIVCFVIWDFA